MRLIRLLVLLFSILLASCSIRTGHLHSVGRTSFSSDSRYLFFDYCEDDRCDLVMLDLATRDLTFVVPSESQFRFSSPGIAPDANQLIAIIRERDSGTKQASQVVLIDWHRNTFWKLTQDDGVKASPNFSYDGRKVAYIESHRGRTWADGSHRPTSWDVHILDLSTGLSSRATSFCFYELSPPFFMPGSDDFVFSGHGPMCNYPQSSVADHTNGYLKYRELYAEDEIVRVGPARQSLEPWFRNGGHSTNPSVSKDGTVMFVSRINDMDGIKRGNYSYDLFAWQDGQIRRLTQQRTFIKSSALSADGKLAAYVSDPERDHHFSLWLLSLESKSSERIPLPALDGSGQLMVRTRTVTETTK